MRSLILSLALISTPAMAAEQFDLICTAKKETVRYRIDLAAGEWCADSCRSVLKIASVTEGTITLLSRERQAPSDVQVLKKIERSTGEWTDISVGGGYDPVFIKGRCEAAPFSGFPAKKF